MPAITSTAGAETVGYADAIRNAAVFCTNTSEFTRFLNSTLSAQVDKLVCMRVLPPLMWLEVLCGIERGVLTMMKKGK